MGVVSADALLPRAIIAGLEGTAISSLIRMTGIRVCCFERPPSVYQLGADGRAYLVSGRDLGPVDLHPNDALGKKNPRGKPGDSC